MLTENTLKELNGYLAKSMARYGLDAPLRVDCTWGSGGEVAVPIAYARENREGVMSALRDFLSNPLVDGREEVGVHIDDPDKLDDDEDTAWCLFDVKGKDGENWYLSDKEIEERRQADEEARREEELEASLTDALDASTRRLRLELVAAKLPEVVYSPMAYEWYDRIASGEKTVEYKNLTRYWLKRLVGAVGADGVRGFPKYIRFQRGYGGPGRPKPDKMTFEIAKVVLSDEALSERPITDGEVEAGFNPAYFAIILGRRVA